MKSVNVRNRSHTVMAVDVAAPPLESYQILGSGAGKTFNLDLYDAESNLIAQQTGTVGATALLLEDVPGISLAGAVGAICTAADATVYYAPTSGDVTVDSSNGETLAIGSILGSIHDTILQLRGIGAGGSTTIETVGDDVLVTTTTTTINSPTTTPVDNTGGTVTINEGDTVNDNSTGDTVFNVGDGAVVTFDPSGIENRLGNPSNLETDNLIALATENWEPMPSEREDFDATACNSVVTLTLPVNMIVAALSVTPVAADAGDATKGWVRYTFDGSTPSATVGNRIRNGTLFLNPEHAAAIKFIAEAADSSVLAGVEYTRRPT